MRQVYYCPTLQMEKLKHSLSASGLHEHEIEQVPELVKNRKLMCFRSCDGLDMTELLNSNSLSKVTQLENRLARV